MYPGALVANWYDQSELNIATETPDLTIKPLFMVVSSFDKGPEDLREIDSDDFKDYYGTPTFDKHGQNGIQAQRIIDAGGTLLVKRICAPDSTIANVVLSAKVAKVQTQKVDAEGHPLYLDAEGNETTSPVDEEDNPNTPIMLDSAKVKWEATSISNCKTFEEVKEAALDLYDESTGTYPLFIYVDNGRGVSSKAVRLIPDYNTSKGFGYMYYDLKIYEGTNIAEDETVTVDPYIVYNNTAYGIDKGTCKQIDAIVDIDVYNGYIAKVADILGLDTDTVRAYDLVYGYDCKGAAIPDFVIDAESVDLNATFGVELKNGTNGSFGEAPAGTAAWTEEIRKVFAGEVTDDVWDVDAHKVAVICDAAFPLVVKDAIADFVNFRQDCVFFRDYGLDIGTFTDIRVMYNTLKKKGKFIADYSTTYTIKDPSTKKNIQVTMMYDLAACLVAHFDHGCQNPCAGIANDFVLESAIKGTLNFRPVVTPSVNQKSAMEDIHVNYADFNEDQCVVQTCFTSQEANTELSYVNNVLAIQEVIRALRTYCPRQRYRLVTGTDLSDYARACTNTIEPYRSHFAVLNFTYTEDKVKSAQKIFYASIEFAFNQWAQTEIFDIFVLNSGNL